MSGWMFVCLLPMAGWTAGLIKTKLGIGTHVDIGSVLVKVKVIYLCVRYNRIHERIHDRKFISAPSGEQQWTMRSISSSSAVAAATWWMLMKLLTEARKCRENSSTIIYSVQQLGLYERGLRTFVLPQEDEQIKDQWRLLIKRNWLTEVYLDNGH